MRRPAINQPQNCPQHDHPQYRRNFPDRRDPPVQQQHRNRDHRNRNRAVVVRNNSAGIFRMHAQPPRHRRNLRRQIHRIIRKPQRARRNAQRRLKKRLPDKQERHQSTQPVRPVRLPKKNVTSTRLRHRCAQFRPHASVQRRQHRSHHPRQNALRPAHRVHDERNHDERANTHHERHVQRRRLDQPQPTLEFFRFTHAAAPKIPSPVEVFRKKQESQHNKNAKVAPRKLLRSALS